MAGNRNLIHEHGSQFLERPSGAMVVRVAGNGHNSAHPLDKRAERTTSQQGVATTAKRGYNFIANVPGTHPDVLGIPNAKVDVPDISALGVDHAKVIVGNQPPSRITRHDPIEPQLNLPT